MITLRKFHSTKGDILQFQKQKQISVVRDNKKFQLGPKFFQFSLQEQKHHIAAKKGVLALLKEGIFVFFLAKGTSLK